MHQKHPPENTAVWGGGGAAEATAAKARKAKRPRTAVRIGLFIGHRS
jgi:hypothetical protein